MPDTGPRLAVIIPYFQRKPGLLSKAIRSVLAHASVIQPVVLVVDDSSPHPADAEVDLAWLSSAQVRVIHQPNAGPSAARNRGLDMLPSGVEYVAFLDSDDHWTETFAVDALAAFDAGADLFFADTLRFSESTSRFNWVDSDKHRLSSQGHTNLFGRDHVFAFEGDFLDLLVHRTNVMGSSFAYRLECARELRFDRALTYGEDRLFKLSLARRCRRVAFSARIGCIEGPGVNIFDVVNPGSGRALRLTSDYIHLNRLLLRSMPWSATQEAWLRLELGRCRREWLVNTMHALRLGTPELRANIALTIKRDPGLPLAVLRDHLRPSAA